MEITVDELLQYNNDDYQLIDIRTEEEMVYGTIPGSVNIQADSLLENTPDYGNKLLVICCRRGVISADVAASLEEKNIKAASLKGGYNAWILNKLHEKEDDNYNEKVENSIHRKYRKSIWSNFTKALKVYKLVNDGDKVAVCISGGKDSMLMAKLFLELKKYSEVNFDVEYIVMDPGYSPENRKVIEENARRLHIPIKVYESDIFDSVYTIEKSPCYLCARMRRGHLYSYAKELGCNKIALGHHYDDVIETILMGMLYGAQIQTMMPKLHSTNFEGMELIRPMYFIRESDIMSWRDYNDLHFIQCACKFTENCATCTNEETKSKRLETKQLIKTLKEKNPEIEAHIFKSVENVCLDAVIEYKTGGKRVNFLDNYDN